MKITTLKIADKKTEILSITLLDILRSINNGSLLHWSVLYLWATGKLKNNQSMPDFEEKINNSQNGLLINWDELYDLSKQFYQVIDLLLIGSTKEENLKRYKNEQTMGEKCDIVIEMHDSSFWLISSKDSNIINNIRNTFKDVKILN